MSRMLERLEKLERGSVGGTRPDMLWHELSEATRAGLRALATVGGGRWEEPSQPNMTAELRRWLTLPTARAAPATDKFWRHVQEALDRRTCGPDA